MTDALGKQVHVILAPYMKTEDGSIPKWLLALSGGSDSVFLLHMLVMLRDRKRLDFKAVHVNHGLRGTESEADAQFCADLCHVLNIPLSIRNADVVRRMQETKTGMEEAARDARYLLLKEEAEVFEASAILLAHQQEDQAETVLMHLLRGAGLSGLTGMTTSTRFGLSSSEKPIELLRPLLFLRKSDMQAWLTERNLSWREDGSNCDPTYARNRLRNQIMPLLAETMQVNPTLALARCAALLQQDENCLAEIAEKAYTALIKRDKGRLGLDVNALVAMHPAVISRVLRLLWETETGTKSGLEMLHVNAVLHLVQDMRQRKPGKAARKITALPGKMIAVCTPYLLWLERKTDTIDRKPDKQIWINGPGQYPICVPEAGIDGVCQVTRCSDRTQVVCNARESDMTQYFDAERLLADLPVHDLGMNVIIRFRRTGDIFFGKGAPGSKKLKDWMIDAHMPVTERDRTLLLAKGNDIVWLVGHRTGERYRVTENTSEIWELTWQQAANLEE